MYQDKRGEISGEPRLKNEGGGVTSIIINLNGS